MKLRSCYKELVLVLFFSFSQSHAIEYNKPIDRHALVTRHNIVWNDINGQIPLGNGEFCFNADGTGLQTFGGSSMAHWAWHSFPLPSGITPNKVPATGTFQKGRNKGFDVFPTGTEAIRQWMFDNPHSFNLGRISLMKASGQKLVPEEISNLTRKLDLWSGKLISTFIINGKKVQVETSVNPKIDQVSVRIISELLETGELQVGFDFPYPSIQRNEPWVGKFNNSNDDNHTTLLYKIGSSNRADFLRKLDDYNYYSTITWSKGGCFQLPDNLEGNTFVLIAKGTKKIEFNCTFSPKTIASKLSTVEETEKFCKNYWPSFWKSGGAIDLSQSKDPRWKELERRIVLSQYLTATQSSGSFPPAEVGLMGIDSWRGQFHLEMIWWHLAHFSLWDRSSLMEKPLGIYQKFIPAAKQLAEQLGYKGLQWPKSSGPEGRTAPWEGNQILLWKQPHPIFFAELDYRLHPTVATLKKWADIIEGTAGYMADYPVKDSKTGIFHLEPVMPPSEQGITKDDIFDLAYWTWGLEQAQVWRERMGLKRNPHWEEVRLNLAKLPVQDGLFLHSAEWIDTYTKRAWEHPNTIGVWGMLPPQKGMEFEIAHNSLLKVWKTWDWKRCWGWDFPWTAMAAARLGEPKIAVDALLLDAGTKNNYDERGVNTGGPCPYLPGNGGLLYAVAMMAAGWDGAPSKNAPGFPDDGSWTVRWEGLNKAP